MPEGTMSVQSSKFAMLMGLAKEASSDRRRDLLREVTDVFLNTQEPRTEAECAAFDEVVGVVASDLETEVRIELARKVAASTAPLNLTARRLALDEIAVAKPVIEGSQALTEADLLAVVAQKSQDHMVALTKRSAIGERVSGALVERGEDHVVASLLQNRNAKIDRATYEKVTERAQDSAILHAPIVHRQDMPLDLLNDVYLKVEAPLRNQILKVYDGVSPDELNAAITRSRKRLSKAYGALPADYDAARRRVADLERQNKLLPPSLVSLMREGQASRTAFLLAFAKLTGVDYELINRLVENEDIDAIAMLCRASGFERSLFVALAVAIIRDDRGMIRAEEFGKLYLDVPEAAAQRAIRFWKVRAKAETEGDALPAKHKNVA